MKKTLFIILTGIIVLCMQQGSYAARKIPSAPRKAQPKRTLKMDMPKRQTFLNENKEQKAVPFRYPPAPVQEDKMGLAVGIKAGASAGLTGAMGDVSYSLDKIISGASLRGSVGYLTGASNIASDPLKMATVNLDAIYAPALLNPANSPFQVYLGGGFIYPLKVNRNRGAGAWGAHAYLGSKYNLQDNTSLYGELAYTGIKYQADEAALRGVEAMMGYSYSF